MQDFTQLSTEEKFDVLKYSQSGFNSVTIIHVIIFILWILATGVPGFNQFDGSSSWNANTHGIWWIAIDALVLLWAVAAPFFTLHYTRNGIVEKGVARTHQWLLVYMVLAGIGALVNLLHLILTVGEIVTNCDSTLCANYKWCFIALLVFLIFHTFLLVWSIFRAYAYYLNLKAAIQADPELFALGSGAVLDSNDDSILQPPSNGNGNGASAPPAGKGEDMYGRITTPLLQARYAGKIQHVAPRHQSMKK